ncbi:hypothetical protein [Algoriphagus limi]|uniref:DUF5723 domain-containing protein n=1 Tax=Algoriphagus limi TaxID=2975273 RepID=A0ABT2G5A4_9BACT|nr:hypothetical protein [Algoriphagus limi]MCS5490451.1 hypothetical protein [Algoriphagus limi]
MKYRFLFLIFLLSGFLINRSGFSQTLIGAQIDNRAGIKGLTLNPANVINPRLKAEIHLFSASAYVGNDYIGLNLGDLNQVNDFRSFQENSNINSKPDNNFVGNLDIFRPGFQFNIDPKNSLALTTRFRTFFNLNNVGGEFFESIVAEDESSSYEVLMRDLSGILHVWGELGLTYGRVLLENSNYSLKGAATFKYLAGAGGVIGSSNLLGAIYLETPNSLTTRGNLDYGYSNGFESGEVDLGDFQSGFGMDIGFIFELQDQTKNAYSDGYKFKAGVSIMDIGGIKYPQFGRWNYDLDKTVDLDGIEETTIREFLEQNYVSAVNERDTRLAIPTSLQIFADYALSNRFYISAHGSYSLRKHQEVPVSQIVNSIVITPRMETGWFSLYSPISYRQFEGGISWGVGLRLGPVTIGSASILTNLLSKNSRSTDAYFGVQIPIYKKGSRINQP